MTSKPLYRFKVANEVYLEGPILQKVPEQKRDYFSRVVSRLLEKDGIKNEKITVKDIDPQKNTLETEDENGVCNRPIQDKKFELQRGILYDVVQRSYREKSKNTGPLSHKRASHPFQVIEGGGRKASRENSKTELVIISEETRNKKVIRTLQSLFPEISVSHVREVTSMHYNIASPHDTKKIISFVKIFDEQGNISRELIEKGFNWDRFIGFIERSRINSSKIEFIFLSDGGNIKIIHSGTPASYKISS